MTNTDATNMELNGRFVHVYVPGEGAAAGEGAAEPIHDAPRPLLLLHGTGGNERQLVSLGRTLAPGAPLLSPRGRVDENGMARFFRRIAEGVFDVEDLITRTHELASFMKEAQAAYGLTGARFVAVGFSNGANMAGSLLLLYPELFAGAVLYRPMVPFTPETMPDLSNVAALVMPGERDPLVPREESERLAQLLEEAGAEVRAAWQPVGHGLTDEDIAIAREWLATLPSH